MSRFSLNSTMTIHYGGATDSDATCSSTSSATNNSSNSLSVSPAADLHRASSSSSSSTSTTTLNLSPSITGDFGGTTTSARQQQPYQSPHSTTRSNLLLELQREIKEEEEEIFADINSLLDARSRLYASNGELDDDDAIFLHHGSKFATKLTNLRSDIKLKSDINLDPNTFYEHPLASSADSSTNFISADEQNFTAIADPHQQELAAEDEDEQADYQALQSVIQQVTSNLPKPCVFFLEGNCRRSDCKYSHDLSNITCKYWIEGFCFKGDTCPFSHSFILDNGQDAEMDEEMLAAMAKKQLDPTFVIESESDFPSLPLDAPVLGNASNRGMKLNPNIISSSLKNQILSSNPSVVFKTVKKKRKKA